MGEDSTTNGMERVQSSKDKFVVELMDKLIERLADKVLKTPDKADLDSTTFEKPTNLGISLQADPPADLANFQDQQRLISGEEVEKDRIPAEGNNHGQSMFNIILNLRGGGVLSDHGFPRADELRKHKFKRILKEPNSYFMDVKCHSCPHISTMFSHSSTTILCEGCGERLCKTSGGKAKLTIGCKWKKKD